MSLYARDLDGYYIENGVFWNPAVLSTVISRFNSRFDFQQKVSSVATPITSAANMTVVSVSDGTRFLMDEETRIYDRALRLIQAKNIRIGTQLASINTPNVGVQDPLSNNQSQTITDQLDSELPFAFMAAFANTPADTPKRTLETALDTYRNATYDRAQGLDFSIERRAAVDIPNALASVDYNALTLQRNNNPRSEGFLQNIAGGNIRGIDLRRALGHDIYPISDPAVNSDRNFIIAYNMGLYAGSSHVTRSVSFTKTNDRYLLPELRIVDNTVFLVPYDLLNERGTVLTRYPLLDPNERANVIIPFLSGFIDSNSVLTDDNRLILRFVNKREMQDVYLLFEAVGIYAYRNLYTRNSATQLLLSGANTIHFMPYEMEIDSHDVVNFKTRYNSPSKLLENISVETTQVRTTGRDILTVTQVQRNQNISNFQGLSYRIDLSTMPDTKFALEPNNVLLRFNRLVVSPTFAESTVGTPLSGNR